MSPFDTAVIRARLEAATPGPWAYESVGEKSNDWIVGLAWSVEGECLISGEIPADHAGLSEVIVQRLEPVCEAQSGPDAKFIAHAPEDISTLLEENKRLHMVAAKRASAVQSIHALGCTCRTVEHIQPRPGCPFHGMDAQEE